MSHNMSLVRCQLVCQLVAEAWYNEEPLGLSRHMQRLSLNHEIVIELHLTLDAQVLNTAIDLVVFRL